MKYMLRLLIFSSVFILIKGEPCLDYQTIDTWERSVANTLGSACDALLPEGWYRIISNAGELMPTECIIFGGRCGTAYPVWLNGSYPNTGVTVNVTACASNYDGNCCFKSYDIQIKNCSDYYVYNLIPVDGCPQSYCFGTELPCPMGETSETGFTPGCKFDPCLEINYKELDDWKRSLNYDATQTICDSFLEPGWYRPTSKAGNLMPTECPQSGFRCGTVYPIWMNGSYPEVNQTANVTACSFSHLGGCCEDSYDIQVKNCGDFHVYNLAQTTGCDQAYCFGTEVHCPVGQISENGFTPGCQLNPCHSHNYITRNGEDKRSSAFIYQSGSSPIDDSTLNDGWYRFDSYVGNDLVNEQQSMMRCGTEYPVWLNGNLPSVADETVNRTCCLSGIHSMCESTVNIQIRNCGSFRVYNLVQLQTSSSAYCVGTRPVYEPPVPTDDEKHKSIEKWVIPVVVTLSVLLVLMVGMGIYHKFLRKNICSPGLPESPPPYSEIEQNQKNIVLAAQGEKYVTVPPMIHEIPNQTKL